MTAVPVKGARVKGKWVAQIQSQTGEIKEVKIETHWDPDYEGMADAVAHAAAVKTWYQSHKDVQARTPYVPLTAVLKERPGVTA